MAGKQGGKKAKMGRNSKKCTEYRSRNNLGRTIKARRIFKLLAKGLTVKGWYLNQAKTAAMPENTTKKKT